MTPGGTLADFGDRTATRFPVAVPQTGGGRTHTWAECDRRADGIAHTLLHGGAQQQDKVAHYLYNSPEYLESMFGMYKAALVPVNTNYRYTDDELTYLWENSDAVAVVFHGTFTSRCEHMRARLPTGTTWTGAHAGTTPRPA